MSDLHLTSEQITELSDMGIAGRMVAKLLRLWRECPAAPWKHISLAAIFRTEFDKNEPVSAMDAVEFTIVHTRNNIELLVASLFWTLRMKVDVPGTSDENIAKRKMSKEKIAAIQAAVEKE